jgi:hypothetical protein
MGDAAAAAEAQKRAAEAAAALNKDLTAKEAANKDLYAQTNAVMNIKVLVTTTLDKPANNYGRWRSSFLTVLGKYNLKDHVLSDDAYPARSVWAQMDCCVLTWVYCTVSSDLEQALMIRDPTARDAWKYLEDEFLGQRESRALLMEAEFCSFKQGALSVTDYCRHLETMAASLKEFGDPIGDRQLVLTLLRGLNAKFRHMVSNLKMQRPFPTFAEARTLLLLEEIDIHDVIDDPCSEPKTGTQALVVQQPPRTPAPPGGSGAPSGGTGGNGNGGRNRRRGRGNNNGHSGTNNKGAGQPGSRPGTPLPPPGYGYGAGGHGGHGAPGSGYGASGFGAPWPGWHPDYGVYPPRPPVDQQPQAGLHMMAHQGGYQQPPPPGFGYVGGTPPPPSPSAGAPLYGPWNPMAGGSWDQASLTSNFNAMTLTPPNSAEWYADSGAGSHMTAQPGILSSPKPPSLSGPSSIIVGNGSLLPITSTGSYSFNTPQRPLVLNDVLVSSSIIKNLILFAALPLTIIVLSSLTHLAFL